jgi:hypothetical protein
MPATATSPRDVAGVVEPGVRFEGLKFRLDPANVQEGFFTRSAGARRFCANQEVAAVHASQAMWSGQRAAELPASERVRPLSAIGLRAAWRETQPSWSDEMSSWVCEHAVRDAATAHTNLGPAPSGPVAGHHLRQVNKLWVCKVDKFVTFGWSMRSGRTRPRWSVSLLRYARRWVSVRRSVDLDVRFVRRSGVLVARSLVRLPAGAQSSRDSRLPPRS